MKPCLWTARGLNCSDHAQVLNKLEYMKPLLMATRNCTRDSLNKSFISNIVCVVIVERATGSEVFCSQDVIITLSFFQGSSLREATNLEQSHSRVVAQEKGLSSKHGEEESQAVKQSCRSLETGNLSCHFLRKGWICCALSVAVAICSKPVCHHDFKMYELVRASKNWCQIRADQLTDFVSDKTSYPENQLYLSVFVWLCTKPRYVDFQAQPQLTKISENPKLKPHLATVASPVLEAGFSSVFGVEDTREGNGYSVWHGSVGHVSWTFF